LQYYTNENEKDLRGTISLVNVHLYEGVEKDGTDMENYFNIRTVGRDYLIRAKDTEDKDKWIKLIARNIAKDPTKPTPHDEETPPVAIHKRDSWLGQIKNAFADKKNEDPIDKGASTSKAKKKPSQTEDAKKGQTIS